MSKIQYRNVGGGYLGKYVKFLGIIPVRAEIVDNRRMKIEHEMNDLINEFQAKITLHHECLVEEERIKTMIKNNKCDHSPWVTGTASLFGNEYRGYPKIEPSSLWNRFRKVAAGITPTGDAVSLEVTAPSEGKTERLGHVEHKVGQPEKEKKGGGNKKHRDNQH
jgi:hypothetical protein